MLFRPLEFQHLISDFIYDNERGNVLADMGVGKTGSSLDAVANLILFGEVDRLLVLAPKPVALTTWPDEVAKFSESFGHLSIAAAIGTPDERLAALRRRPQILTINYDNIGWLIEQYGDNWPFDMVIADESTRLKGLRISMQQRERKDGTKGPVFIAGQGAKRAKALGHIAHKRVRRWINLTGSFAPNGLIDAWGQQWFVDGGKRLGNSFDGFAKRYFHMAWGSTREQQRLEINEYADKQIHKLLAQTSIRIDAKDWFDLKEPVERHIMIDLPPRARQQYKELQKDCFTFIDEHPLEVFAAGAKLQKCLQVASGSVWIDRDEQHWEPVHNAKLEALRSIVEETGGQPLLIAYQFKPDLERILKAFPQFKALTSKAVQRDFEEGRLAGLVVHPKSAGHGLNLQKHCHILVDYSSGYNLEEDDQVLGRVGPVRQAQIGSDKVVFRYRIVARNTLEQYHVLPTLAGKLSAQDTLKQAIKMLR